MNIIKDYRKVIQLNASKEMVTSWWWGGRRLDQKMLGKVMGRVFTCAEMGLSRAYVRWFGGSGRVPRSLPERDGAGGHKMRGLVNDFGVG